MAKAKDIPGLGPEVRFADAAAMAVEVRAEEVFSFAEGVLDTDDIERVHDMRVATRRLRAVMEIFAPCFPAKEHKRMLREVKALADVLGERRDPDVAIEELEAAATGLTTADRAGVEGLVAELRAEQEDGNRSVARALKRMNKTGLRERLQALAAEARPA